MPYFFGLQIERSRSSGRIERNGVGRGELVLSDTLLRRQIEDWFIAVAWRELSCHVCWIGQA